jgi:D-alanyl-D-alanine carboxypeptidase (penicillin-binding protein 5/6)
MKPNTKLFLAVMLLLTIMFLWNVMMYHKNADIIRVNAMSITGAKAMVVMDVDSKRVLLSKNKSEQMPMASTTKIMTAILAIEESDNLDEMVQINDNAVGIEGTSIYLRKGERMPLRELLYGLMLASGNDASMAIAYHIGNGSLETFVEKMNQKAVEIGANNTQFVNPHGLDAKGHYTTAYDLALITAYAHQNEDYRQIAGTKKMQITSTPEGHNRFLLNKQRLLKTYEWCVGGKTGFTDNAGRCSVAVSEKDGLQLVTVVLNAPNMFEDSIRAFNAAYDTYKKTVLLKPYQFIDSLPVSDGREGLIKLYTEKGFSYPLKYGEKANVIIEKELPEVLSAPLKKEEPVGKLKIYLDKDLLFSENIYTIESVENVELSNTIKDIIKRWFYD